MIPQPIVSRFVSRPISAADAGRGARLHPVLAPPRIRLGEPDRVHPGLVHRARRREHLVERLHRELHDADAGGRRLDVRLLGALPAPARRAPCRTCCTCWFTIGWRTRWPIEPTGPRIFTSALHAIEVPSRGGVGERERRLHVHDRADAVALDRELRELRLALLDLLHVDLHLQAAEAERDLHVRRPAPVVVDVEALDAGHRLRHRRRVVQHLPHRRRAARRRSRSPETFTPLLQQPPDALVRVVAVGHDLRRSRPGSPRRRRGCRRRRPRPFPSCRAA